MASVVASEEVVSHHIGQRRTIWYRRASVELTAGSVGSLDPPGHTLEMNMAQNMGTPDRAVRIVVAVVAALVAGWAGFGTAAAPARGHWAPLPVRTLSTPLGLRTSSGEGTWGRNLTNTRRPASDPPLSL